MMKWIGIALAIVLGDGAVKKCAEKKLADGRTKDLFGGRIRLELLHNPGVALGVLAKNGKAVLVLNAALLGAAAAEFAEVLKSERGSVTKIGLALLIGGGASNLIDRLERGYVTDYFSIQAGQADHTDHAGARFQKLKNIVFNISDFCIFAGLFCYLAAACICSRQSG